jgi:tRNA-dependent cyclodipeptide synthase
MCSAAHESAKSSSLFIPISLGNHYYSYAILQSLLDDFIAPSNRSVVFLCDRLRFLSYLIRGETNIPCIISNTKNQVNQLTRALVNLGIQSFPHAIIADWSFCQNDEQYNRLVSDLQLMAKNNSSMRRELDNQVNRLIEIHRSKESDVARRTELQLEYVIEETALSLYMTEIRGYNVEIYRRGMGFVDYLYRRRHGDLLALTRKSVLNRKFIPLER